MISKFHETCKKIDAGLDQDLKDYFIRTRAIDELLRFESEKVIAVGLKGLGKTAAFRYFNEFETESDIIIGIDPEKYTLHLPNQNLHYATCRKQFEHDLVIEALKAVVREQSGKEPDLVETLDAGILGGLIVQVGDKKLDSSVARKLETLTNRLLERAAKEIHGDHNYVVA